MSLTNYYSSGLLNLYVIIMHFNYIANYASIVALLCGCCSYAVVLSNKNDGDISIYFLL